MIIVQAVAPDASGTVVVLAVCLGILIGYIACAFITAYTDQRGAAEREALSEHRRRQLEPLAYAPEDGDPHVIVRPRSTAPLYDQDFEIFDQELQA